MVFMDIWRDSEKLESWYIFYEEESKEFFTVHGEKQAIELMGTFQKKLGKKLNIMTCDLEISGINLINFMLKNDWYYSEQISEGEKFFNAFITDNDCYYSLKLYFKANKTGKKTKVVELKNFDMLIDNFKKYSKNDIQTFTNFKVDESDITPYIPTEIDMIPLDDFTDIAEDLIYLSKANELLTSSKMGFYKNTVGSCAFTQYTNMLNRSGRHFETYFPKLPKNVNSQLRYAYSGGINLIFNDYQGKIVEDIRVIDINSIYGYALKSNLMPVGEPLYYTGKYSKTFTEDYPLYVQSFSCRGWSVKDGSFKSNYLTGIPCLKLSFGEEKYIENSALNPEEYNGDYQHYYSGKVTLHLTNVDLEMFLENYDVLDLNYIDGFMFRGKRGLFTRYIDKWDKVKIACRKNKRKIMGDIAKKMTVTFYGKFGQNETAYRLVPYILDDDCVDEKGELLQDIDINNMMVKFTRVKEDIKPKYLPVSIFTTAYARQLLVNAMSVFKDKLNIIYCDTDSIHFTGYLPKPYKIRKSTLTEHRVEYNDEIETKEILIGDELGKFKFEGHFKRGRYHNVKCYCLESDDGSQKIAIVGMPKNNHGGVTVENLEKGLCIACGHDYLTTQGKYFSDGDVFEIT